MLEKVANLFEDEVDQAVKNISGIIEPVMIIFLGLAVVLIVIAVLFPIYGLVNQVGSSGSGSGTNF
jgi:type IV pilus assembly protein PilC